MKHVFGIIYKAEFPNGKVYIGQTTRNLSVRKNQHINKVSKENVAFHNAIGKYGVDTVVWSIIDTADSIQELNDKEIYWISEYNSYIHSENSNGYNMTLGGHSTLGWIPPQEVKDKISASNKGRRLSEKQKATLSKLLSGNGNPMFGKAHSPEARQKMKEAATGRVASIETRAKMSSSQKDRVFTDEHRKKLSEGAHKMWLRRKNGENNGF